MWQMMMYTPHILRELYLRTCFEYVIFLKNIDDKKLEKVDESDDDVYTLHIKRLAINDL
jgi:hypothetical protein